jgi:tRNA threonylcarbamoyladenosine biosynthesis protein TsaE
MPEERDPVAPGPAYVMLTRTEADTAEVGCRLGALAQPDDVIALSGGLGAGKTVLAQGIARGMGIVEHIPSPTFNLLLVHPGEFTLYHFDLYRLEAPEQLDDIDFWATVEAGGVSVVEWADRFPGTMPDGRLDVLLEVMAPTERRVTLVAHGDRARAMAAAIAGGEVAAP